MRRSVSWAIRQHPPGQVAHPPLVPPSLLPSFLPTPPQSICHVVHSFVNVILFYDPHRHPYADYRKYNDDVSGTAAMVKIRGAQMRCQEILMSRPMPAAKQRPSSVVSARLSLLCGEPIRWQRESESEWVCVCRGTEERCVRTWSIYRPTHLSNNCTKRFIVGV